MSYLLSKPISVHNPYNWLPSDGESSVSFRTDRGDLVVSIVFEQESGVEQTREIRFINCCAFYVSAMPGVAALNVSAASKPEPLGHLLQWTESGLADQWSNHFGKPGRYTHFVIFFLEANKVLDVVCEAYLVAPQSTPRPA